MHRLRPWFALLLLVPAGCGQSGPERFEVEGTVTFDGRPVSDGQIVFVPPDGQGRPDAGRIVDGRFRCEVTAGPKRIEVTAHRPDPTRMVPDDFEPDKLVPEYEQYIPARFNTASELTMELAPARNDIEIHLESDSG